MFTSIKLGNFKAFGPTQTIPIRPITLLFGPNSAGKSSIIQSLLLFHEVERNSRFTLHSDGQFGCSYEVSRGNFDVQHAKLGGNLVDLGGFASFIHGGREQSSVNLSLEWDLSHPAAKEAIEKLEEGLFEDPRPGQFAQGELEKFPAGANRIGVTVQIGRGLTKSTCLWPKYDDLLDDVRFEKKKIRRLSAPDTVVVQKCEISLDGVWSTRFERISEWSMELVEVNASSAWVRNNFVNEKLDLRKPEDAAWFEVVGGLLPEYVRGKHRALFRLLHGEEIPLAKLCSVLRKVASVGCSSLEYLGGMRTIPPRHLGLGTERDANWSSAGRDAWDWLMKSPKLVSRVNEWLASAPNLQVPFRLQIHQLLDADTTQRTVEKALQRHSTSLDSQVKAVNRALEKLKRRAPRELRLVIPESGTVISHRDVGLGISQMLPIIVNAIGGERGVYCIEQPELHLHPALQSELGDVFIRSAVGGQGNTFILETHSEHLLLRIMRRLRESHTGKLPKNLPPLLPEHVSVLYIEPGPQGSRVREMPLNNRGELVKAWPGGFFEEGLREATA